MTLEQFEKDLSPKDDGPIATQLAARYRALFGSAVGVEVLTDMLVRLDFFSTLETPEAVARHNYAMELLAIIGVLQVDPKKIIGAMLSSVE